MPSCKMLSCELPLEVTPPPNDLENEFQILFDRETVDLITKMARQFDKGFDDMMQKRQAVRNNINRNQEWLPSFLNSKARQDPKWQVAEIPKRCRDLRVIIGDMTPARTDRFETYMETDAQAIQVDFDDGHCPTYRNQLVGWYNIYRAARNELGDIRGRPVMLIRPRAWNITDHCVLVDGKEVPGALLDFAVIMSHNGKLLHEAESGPWFILPKLESATEAQLWDNIFTWTEKEMGLPHGTIKGHVQIENILATFEMDEILFALKDHSIGLNCGIWDYSASFINIFGDRKEFVIPDRRLYVNVEQPFLKNYINLLIHTCHKRGAPATGGMAALTLPDGHPMEWKPIIEQVCKGKRREIEAGVDGFLFYDINMLRSLKQIWEQIKPGQSNQWQVLRNEVPGQVTVKDLLTLPSGGVTRAGLTNNIAIGILFIQSWKHGEGVFVFNGQVEDSATAEISRSQIWQWIRHGVRLEDDHQPITRELVWRFIDHFLEDVSHAHLNEDEEEWQEELEQIRQSAGLFKLLVQARSCPEYVSTYINDESFFAMQGQF